MTPERWRQVTAVFHAALAHDAPARARYLDKACAADPALRAEVDAMLGAHATGGNDDASHLRVPSATGPLLESGRMIGSYRIEDLIGAGGMGEVYRARDTKLKRQVALKVLPSLLASDRDRLARFQHEAEVLASVNHPNIAAIYGLEDSETTHALVMELVEGPTLADRIAHGPMPLDEALPIARQIAEALEAAHEHGIVHRDLKPANVKVRPDGTVKVLDFGLAKALGPASVAAADLSHSPTITSPATTRQGVILGTAAYMSPEQARGKPVDRRADVWALGCVLYEMLTGRRAFHGDDVTETLAAVMKGEPDWTALPVAIPPNVRFVLRRCLEKDTRRRFHAAIDVAIALEEPWSVSAPATAASGAAPARPVWRRLAPWGVAVVLSLGTGLGVWSLTSRSTAGSPTVSRLVFAPPENAPLANLNGRNVIISPDGRRIAYLANDVKRGLMVFMRDIDQLEARAIPGTEDASSPFFSSDGAWIGFERGTALVKVAVSGGPAATILEDAGGQIVGSERGHEDTVIFARNDGLFRVPSGGGPAERLTPEPEKGYRYARPRILPGGHAVIFQLRSLGDTAESERVGVVSLETGEQRMLIAGGHPEYVSSGHLLFLRGTTLMAAPFDGERLAMTGTPVPVAQDVRRLGSGAADYAISDNGTLVYVPGAGTAVRPPLAWVRRDGREEPLSIEPRDYWSPRVSPDGERVAVSAAGDIWIHDEARGTTTRLTFDPANDGVPLWTPDGQRVVFTSNREGTWDLFWTKADGTGDTERLTTGAGHEVPSTWASEGRELVLMECRTPNAGPCDLSVLSMEGDRQARALLHTDFDESFPTVSPDGRWLAYQSNESGPPEIYVRPFPAVQSGRWQVSTGGGTEPLWGPANGELFFRGPTSLMAIEVQTGATPTFGKPQTLFSLGRYVATTVRQYDVSPTGNRFILAAPIRPQGGSSDHIVVVQNWLEELRQLMPTN